MKPLNFTLIKLTCCLIIGIVTGHSFNISITTILYSTALFFIVLSIAYLIAKKQLIKTVWFGTTAFIIMVLIGVLTVNFHNQKNHSKHYTQAITNKTDSLKTITFRVREVLKPNNYYDKFIIDIIKIDEHEVFGKSILSIEKDSTKLPKKVDDIIIINSFLKDLNKPLNPNQFDYKKYLEKQYIYHQLVATDRELLKISSLKHTIYGIAEELRNHINSKLKLYAFKTDELAIINALILGQRQNISEDIYTNYVNAGAIHILAVSGLHVGIILLFLNFIFKPLERIKHGRFVKSALLIGLLWSFAVVAGLSASVTRAVTMFSIVAIGMNYKRPTNIYNTLAISAFIILLFKPLFLFDVGFQLSYLAVFAIVSIDPLLYRLWKPKYILTDKLWHTLTVTLSAQFGILPISLFYFHQIPGLFFISNLVIIPLLGFILGGGILIILLSVLNVLPEFIANLYGYIISGMNDYINWIAQQEQFLFKDISFNVLFVLVSYLLIISMTRLLVKRNYKRLLFFLVTIILIQITHIYTALSQVHNQFIVFHKSRNSLIGNVSKNKMTIAHDFDSIAKSKNSIVKDYAIENNIKIIEEDTLRLFYKLNNKSLFIIDSKGVYNIKSFHHDYVLLRQSPKINLNRIIDSINPKCIIADGSNYKSYIEHWETICKKRKLPFHQTGKKGAFIINY